MDDNAIYTVPCSPPSRISLCSCVSVRQKDVFIVAYWSQHCSKWEEIANNLQFRPEGIGDLISGTATVEYWAPVEKRTKKFLTYFLHENISQAYWYVKNAECRTVSAGEYHSRENGGDGVAYTDRGFLWKVV